MHSVVRHERILTLLRQHGLVSVRRLAREVRASDMTVRRDLAHLCDEGLVRKLHGGAVLAAGKGEETHFSATRQEHVEEKRAIAKEAAALVAPRSVVALPGSSWLMTGLSTPCTRTMPSGSRPTSACSSARRKSG